MRQKLNENPVVAIGVIGLLGVVVALLMLSQASKQGAATSSPTTTAAATTPVGTPAATTAPAAAATDTVPTATPAAPGTAPPDLGAFQAGPGLPASVVDAHKNGDVVAVLVTKGNGIDDRAVQKSLAGASKAPSVSIFQTDARHVARYSRIAEGVDLNRVPAMIVIRASQGKNDGPPKASVIYGFHGPDSIGQALRDAAYTGPDHLPFFPR